MNTLELSILAADLTAGYESHPIHLERMEGYSVMVVTTGADTATGQLKLQASNNAFDGNVGSGTGVNADATWVDIDGSAESVGGTGQFMWNVDGAYYQAVRLVYVADDALDTAMGHGVGTWGLDNTAYVSGNSYVPAEDIYISKIITKGAARDFTELTSGNLVVRVYDNDGGLPGELLVESEPASLIGMTTLAEVEVNLPATLLSAGQTYFIIFDASDLAGPTPAVVDLSYSTTATGYSLVSKQGTDPWAVEVADAAIWADVYGYTIPLAADVYWRAKGSQS